MHIVVQADLDSHNQTLVGRLREIFHSFSKEIGGGYFGGCAVGGVASAAAAVAARPKEIPRSVRGIVRR